MHRQKTFSKFIIEEQRRSARPDPNFTALLNDIQTACKYIAVAVSRGGTASKLPASANVHGEIRKPLDLLTNEIMVQICEFGGQVRAMVSEEMVDPYLIPGEPPRGRYLLVFDPLDGSSNIDVDGVVGTIFSVLRAPDGVAAPQAADFLQPGTSQIAAGYALYGPVAMLVVSLGSGVHGFTLDREIGAYSLTHPDLRIPAGAREFAINASNERFWEPPIRHYMEECIAGKSGPRGEDFNMRWTAAMVAEVHRILIRGGIFMYPRDSRDPSRPGRLRLLYEANPMAMLIEQAGGAASTGRERLLSLQPQEIHQRVPVILGSREEVERVERYHAAFDRGEDLAFGTPLFNTRTLFLRNA